LAVAVLDIDRRASDVGEPGDMLFLVVGEWGNRTEFSGPGATFGAVPRRALLNRIN
jgi:hypothetical protein